MFLLSKKKENRDRMANSEPSIAKVESLLWGISGLTDANIEVGLGLFKKCTQYLELNGGTYNLLAIVLLLLCVVRVLLTARVF
jgi:hypothetical protein